MRQHQAAATRLAWSIAGPADADDAAQDAFIKAFYALDRFRVGEPFRPWLFRIVANEARNRRRRAGRQARLGGRLALVRPSAAASPEDASLADERRRVLVAALNELSERDRAVLAYRFFADLTEAETAAAMDCPTGTVKSRTARALQRLRLRLGEPEGAVVTDA